MTLLYCKLCCAMLLVFLIRNRVEAKESQKLSEVVVVGGGIAGMAAARRLLQEGSMYVRVFEARKDRYGGRIFTNRTAVKGVRGANLDIGASKLNTRAMNNTLLSLVKEFELETKNAGSFQVYFPQREGPLKVVSGDNATDLYSTAFKIAVNALKNAKASALDISVKQLLNNAINEVYDSDTKPKYDRSLIEPILSSLPTMNLEDFSALCYELENEFGWDQIVVDGVGALLDRIVGGATGRDAPIKIELNKVLRNVKVDHNRKKVLVRTTDRKQFVADAVIVALPVGVLQSGEVVFEPKLDTEKYKAIESLGVGYSAKVVVGFSDVFWPREVGTFSVVSDIATNGFLQTWDNMYRVTRNPFLIGHIFGDHAVVWESKSEEEQKSAVLKVLSEVFGKEIVMNHEITTFLVSNWSTDEFVLGSVSYPRVGSTPELWKTLQEPACPYIFFAGAYTDSSGHVDSVHGAYNSGVRAAEQLLSNVCKSKSKATRKAKKSGAKKTFKKDEL